MQIGKPKMPTTSVITISQKLKVIEYGHLEMPIEFSVIECTDVKIEVPITEIMEHGKYSYDIAKRDLRLIKL